MAWQRPTRIPTPHCLGLVMGPCIVEIDHIVIREVQYQLEVNQCRNEEVNEIVARTDGWTDRQTDGRTDGGDKHNIPTFFKRRGDKNFAHLRGTNPKTSPELNQCSITKKTAPPPWQPYIHKTNLFTKFHDDWAKNVTSRDHVIQLIRTIFELNSHIKETNVLTKFQEHWAKIVTSRMFTCFHYIHKEKNAPPTGGNVFSPIWTIFKLVRDINKTNVFTNFHDDWAKIVTSRVFTRKTAPPTGGHVFQRTGTTF
ncbi:hypothetical protein DPMN_032131 [Dreissena polymorpha]|uniref:Uncharacterized protein n=1 Tax=Dreissena polymorpha TaxID=45954 RepID=A0A9D4M5Z1_DREPO|nr:hypothetical protein DPMN_032131 [Dreissena polymorpha]